MDTLESFLLTECFNGEKEVEETSQLNVSQLTTLNSQNNMSQWLGGSFQGLGKKNQGFDSQQLFFFNGKR